MRARDPRHTAAAAKICWVDWTPTDGTTYRVYAPVIAGGPDRADRLLLLNCVGRTIAFQFSLTEYRHREQGPWTTARSAREGIPDWAWNAARPLLEAYGVTSPSLRPALGDLVKATAETLAGYDPAAGVAPVLREFGLSVAEAGRGFQQRLAALTRSVRPGGGS